MKNEITGIILAGGKSSRMGYDKGLAVVHGKKMIEQVYDVISAVTSSVMIIANTDAYNFLGLPVYEDIVKDKGPLGGIYTGLNYSATNDTIVVACDMPLLSIELINQLITLKENKEIVVPTLNGFMEPLCGYYNISILERLKVLIDGKPLPVHKVIQQFNYSTFAIEENPSLKVSDVTNVNSPDDLLKL